jgi:hypothetical protein
VNKVNQKSFQFSFPLSHTIVKDLKIQREHIGSLEVEGFYSLNKNESVLSDERFTIDIDFVRWRGKDIKPVLELTSLMDDVQEAAIKHISNLQDVTPLTHNDLLNIFANNLND